MPAPPPSQPPTPPPSQPKCLAGKRCDTSEDCGHGYCVTPTWPYLPNYCKCPPPDMCIDERRCYSSEECGYNGECTKLHRCACMYDWFVTIAWMLLFFQNLNEILVKIKAMWHLNILARRLSYFEESFKHVLTHLLLANSFWASQIWFEKNIVFLLSPPNL